MSSIFIERVIYFSLAIAFCWMVLFSDVGNYFHGGDWTGWVSLQVIAMIAVVMAIKIFPKINFLEKIVVVFFALAPVAFIFLSGVSMLGRI